MIVTISSVLVARGVDFAASAMEELEDEEEEEGEARESQEEPEGEDHRSK
jgi:hypothetical protein